MKLGVKNMYWSGYYYMQNGYVIKRGPNDSYVMYDGNTIVAKDGNDCEIISMHWQVGVTIRNNYNGRIIVLSFDEYAAHKTKRYEFL